MVGPANAGVVQEFGFELALCAHLEREREVVLSRQLGTHVRGRRVMDVVCVEPGAHLGQRAAITPEAIPPQAIESDVGPGRFRYWKEAFECHPDTAREVVDRAVDRGFFERRRRNGRTEVRQTVRYPRWFDRLVGIENKPDLGRPGDLETQLLTDVRLGLLDAVVLATASHVTGAHRNRIPEEVGIWRFDPESGERTVLREPTPLPTTEPGVEIIDRDAARTRIHVASPDEKRRARRRIAERAYGKGWRSYDLPACRRIAPGEDCLPRCPYKGRVVHPGEECGPACDGHNPAPPPVVDMAGLRAERTPWEPSPDGSRREQVGLDRFI